MDADDLIAEMKDSEKVSLELGKLTGFPGEKEDLYDKLGLGALKYFILKVDPKRICSSIGRINRFQWKYRSIYPIYLCQDQICLQESRNRGYRQRY